MEFVLQESGYRLRKLLKEINMVAVILDTHGNITFANDFFLDLTGRSLASVAGKNFFDTFGIDNKKEEIKLLFKTSLSEGEVPDQYELDIETVEGEKHTILLINMTVHDTAGNVTGVASIGEDITERNKMAEEIKESRKQVLDILESITDGFFALDNDWRFTYVNHRAEELFEIKRENLLFRNIWQILSQEEAPMIFERFYLAKKQMTPVSFEEFIRRFDKWLEIHAYAYKNGLSVYFRDISERKLAEQERLANLQFFESMDQVNRAIQGASSLEQMMSDVLDVVLSVFNCDRVFLLYPCDPETSVWTVPMERTRPEYPGVLAMGIEMPIDPDVAETFRVLLNSSGPVKFGPESDYPLPTEVAERFGFKSFMGMALYPKVGKPWEFGLHQCSYPRAWTPEEERLFQEVGRRLTDGLTSLLTYRDLKESEIMYHSVVTAMGEGVMFQKADGKITAVNSAAERIEGRTTEQMLGRTSEDLQWQALHEDGTPFPGELHPSMFTLRTGQPQSNVIMGIRRPDGERRWISINSQPLIAQGESTPYAVVTTFRDITESKKTFEALQKQEENFRRLIEKSPVAMLVSSGIEEQVQLVSAKFTELFGYTIEDIPDIAHWWPLAYPDKKYREDIMARWTKQVEKAIQTRSEIEPMQATVTCKDGSFRYVEFRLSSIGQRNLVTFIDLTRQKAAEIEQEKLRERVEAERSFLKTVIEQMPMGVLIAEAPTGKVMSGNKSFELFWRRPLEEANLIAAHDKYKAFHLENGEPYKLEERPLYRSLIKGETVKNEQMSYMRGDGTLGVLSENSTPIYDQKGKLIAAVAVFKEVAENA
jgi:PAS domain S-box-containing protein